MPGHGDHWETLYSPDEYIQEKLPRDLKTGQLVCRAPCIDVEDGTERTEQVACLRWGGERLANQILLVSNSDKQSHFLFSGYPVALDGADIDVTISRVESWEYGIEGWVHGSVTTEGLPSASLTRCISPAARLCKKTTLPVFGWPALPTGCARFSCDPSR